MHKSNVRPLSGFCKTNVSVPTISVATKLGRDFVVVQWFGEADGVDLSGIQYQFPLSTSPHHPCWNAHPELFQVIMVGKVKDWPNPEVAQAVAERITGGDTQARILWVASAEFKSGHSHSNPGPVSFALHMNLVLADMNFGIINPTHYCDIIALERLKEPCKA